MTRLYSEQDFSDQLDLELIWRRKELSDLKSAIERADNQAKPVLLRALITLTYAHWEGFVRACANSYFSYVTRRKIRYNELERQAYVNSFLARVDALTKARTSLQERCALINDILDGQGGRFAYVNPDLIDTKSNLNSNVVKEICLICGIDAQQFLDKSTFIDVIILKRRNAIAHGQQEFIGPEEVDEIISEALALMDHFRALLENKVYGKGYRSAGSSDGVMVVSA